MLHYVEPSNKPIILLVHGYFSSNKIGPNRLYFQLANSLANAGFIVLRIDLCGIGESEGDISHVTLDDFVLDLSNITNDLFYKFNKEIFIVAHCLGSLVTLRGLENRKLPHVSKCLFFAPMINSDHNIKKLFLDPQKICELKEKGFTYRKGLYADASFFLNKYDSLGYINAIQSLPNEIITILAERDQFVDKEDINKITATLPETVIIKNADHNFLDISTRTKLLDIVLECLTRLL